MSNVSTGIAAFVNLTETESYNGKDTGAYTVTLTLDDDEAKKLEKMGVNLKEYKNQKQRKFKTTYDNFTVVDVNDDIVSKNIPYGSKVRVLWKDGDPHPQFGTPTYLQKIRVLEYSENEMEDLPSEF